MESQRVLKRKRSEKTKIAKTLKYFQFKYSVFDERIEKVEWFECLLCRGLYNGTKQTNLSSHLKNVHNEIYQEHVIEFDKDTIGSKRMKLLLNCIEIVTVNGQPFSHLFIAVRFSKNYFQRFARTESQ